MRIRPHVPGTAALLLLAPLIAALTNPLPFSIASPDDDPIPLPEGLSSPEAEAAYVAGMIEFQKGNFPAAKTHFTQAKKGAKGAAKDWTGRYLTACAGAKDLPDIQEEIRKERWALARARLEKLLGSHGDTPLKVHLEPLQRVIEENLYLVLSNFEPEPSEYERPVLAGRPDNGVVLATEPELVKQGTSSLRLFWTGQRDKKKKPPEPGVGFFSAIPLTSFDGKWVADYGAVTFWLYVEQASDYPFLLYFTTDPSGALEGKAPPSRDAMRTQPCISVEIPLKKTGWQYFRFDLQKDMQNRFEVPWTDVHALTLGASAASCSH